MKLPEYTKNDTNLFIDECKTTSCLPNNYHSSIQCHSLHEENLPRSIDNKSLPSEYIYTELVKNIGNNEFIEEKRLLKRSSWSPNEEQPTYGLPPTGKRAFGEQSTSNKNFNRVRMRPKTTRHYQLQQPNQKILERPYSCNDKYDHLLIDKLSYSTVNHNGSLPNERREPSPTPSSSSIDSVLQIKTRASPSFDSSDFISDTSTASSMTTVTSLSSIMSSRQKTPIYDHMCSSKTRPLISEYQQTDLNHIDYKFLSPVLNTNTTPLSSPISSLPSSSSFSSSSTSFTCPKGHEESSSPSSSPIGSSLNQYAKFTLQTPTTDSSRDDNGHSTSTYGIMNMSMSSNRYHNQIHSSNSIITSNSTMTNNNDGLKSRREQTNSKIVGSSCLKSQKKDNNNNNNNNKNQTKKSVHFGWHLPKQIRSTSPSTHWNSNSDNDIQTKKNYGEKVEEKEKIEITRRTIKTTTAPLSTNTIHRSFSLSPSLLSKEENNDSRRHRQEKKENVDELNRTTTTSGRATTAATHFHCTTKAATVTFNDGNQNISSTKEPNGTNNFNTSGNLTYSSADKQMPLNTLLVKNSTLNPHTTTPTTKKFTSTGGFFSFINRSNNSHNNNNNNNSSSNNENKQLKRTSSTQQKSKQHKIHGNKRLSADIDTLRSPLISSNNLSKGDIDKVTLNYQEERQSMTDNNTHIRFSCNTNSSIPLRTNTKMNRSSTSMSMNPTTITVKSDEGDSLNNGLLFKPVQSIEKESFFLSPLKSLSNNNESLSSPSIGKIMQTSTLIISTPPQYHYYLYPPTSSISKKNLTTNRSISNISMNSISTNSSSSNASYESHIHDFDEDTLSYSTYSTNNQKNIHQFKSSSKTKPVILSDCVQAFWPPRPSSPPSSILKNIPQQKIKASTIEQNKHSNSINHKHKQSESNIIQNNVINSTYNDDSSSINNGNQTDVLPPTTSLILNNKNEVRSYSEPNSFTNGCLRIASDTSLEDTQASYSERLREKSRSIKATNQLISMKNNNNNNSLSRSRSKDTLENQYENSNSINKNILRPKSGNQVRVQSLFSPTRHEILDDFQSKRQFFENRTYTDYTPTTATTATNNKTYALSTSNNNYQRSETK
ncbi:unnamed protein product [Rotaria sordida]|uniref:Uncharacterized protein n=1 Tax=Rotaria sordida TaxID=392033 RepID=A0A818QY04_9BILA|nr:unnamed protein product [Rotaria sordida]